MDQLFFKTVFASHGFLHHRLDIETIITLTFGGTVSDDVLSQMFEEQYVSLLCSHIS